MKNKKLVAIIITAALTLTACQSSKANIGTSTEVPGDSTSAEETTVSTSSVETSKEDDVKYTYVCAQYIYYNTADELMKACDIVMSGKVTGISFTVRDGRTNDEVTGNTSESDKEICTVYTVEKESAYKNTVGNESDSIDIYVNGGFKDKYIDEQLKALGGSRTITVYNRPEIEIGKSYLFLLRIRDNKEAFLVTPEQGFIDIEKERNNSTVDDFSVNEIINKYFFTENNTDSESE
ncbi:uncharacterized protein BN788_00180 [[Eubacterium] siraeum CAG:80]|uniref:Lipoprotein n=1 Tax=[Eubacterium] siraeum CAG:80 TaxID=1263080 RepID=R6RQY0_9FIRM|nr:uncharacterized protein BN788_00180 [[Eubacterium] siraeum CAG:80]